MQCIFFNGFPIRAGSSPDKRKKPLKNVFNDKLFFYCYIIFYKALKQRKSWLVLAYTNKGVQRWTLWIVIISIFSNIVVIIRGRNVISLNIRGVNMSIVRRTVSQFL